MRSRLDPFSSPLYRLGVFQTNTRVYKPDDLVTAADKAHDPDQKVQLLPFRNEPVPNENLLFSLPEKDSFEKAKQGSSESATLLLANGKGNSKHTRIKIKGFKKKLRDKKGNPLKLPNKVIVIDQKKRAAAAIEQFNLYKELLRHDREAVELACIAADNYYAGCQVKVFGNEYTVPKKLSTNLSINTKNEDDLNVGTALLMRELRALQEIDKNPKAADKSSFKSFAIYGHEDALKVDATTYTDYMRRLKAFREGNVTQIIRNVAEIDNYFPESRLSLALQKAKAAVFLEPVPHRKRKGKNDRQVVLKFSSFKAALNSLNEQFRKLTGLNLKNDEIAKLGDVPFSPEELANLKETYPELKAVEAEALLSSRPEGLYTLATGYNKPQDAKQNLLPRSIAVVHRGFRELDGMRLLGKPKDEWGIVFGTTDGSVFKKPRINRTQLKERQKTLTNPVEKFSWSFFPPKMDASIITVEKLANNLKSNNIQALTPIINNRLLIRTQEDLYRVTMPYQQAFFRDKEEYPQLSKTFNNLLIAIFTQDRNLLAESKQEINAHLPKAFSKNGQNIADFFDGMITLYDYALARNEGSRVWSLADWNRFSSKKMRPLIRFYEKPNHLNTPGVNWETSASQVNKNSYETIQGSLKALIKKEDGLAAKGSRINPSYSLRELLASPEEYRSLLEQYQKEHQLNPEKLLDKYKVNLRSIETVLSQDLYPRRLILEAAFEQPNKLTPDAKAMLYQSDNLVLNKHLRTTLGAYCFYTLTLKEQREAEQKREEPQILLFGNYLYSTILGGQIQTAIKELFGATDSQLSPTNRVIREALLNNNAVFQRSMLAEMLENEFNIAILEQAKEQLESKKGESKK